VAADPDRYTPKLAQAYLKIADRYSQRGDVELYLHYLRLAVAELPETSRLHYRLGNAFWEAGQKIPAARHWQLTLELEPNHPDRLRMLELIRAVRASPD